ncbi:MAG: hypothetical protein WCI57_00095 [Candidatus Berkelbacteria bacterium]
MFKTYLKAWVLSWFAVGMAMTAILGTVACFGKWKTGGFELGQLSAVVASACLVVSLAPFCDTLKRVKKLSKAKILKDWLDFNCKTIDLPVEQLAKAEIAEVCWLKGASDLSEYLFNPHYYRAGDCEYLQMFIDATPLRERKPSAFIVNIQIGDTAFTGQSNYFKGSWKLMSSRQEGSLKWVLFDGIRSREIESIHKLTNRKDPKLVKALSIMEYFDNWAHYERTLTLAAVVMELDSTKGDKATRSPKIRDLKEAIKYFLLCTNYQNENFENILINIRKKSEAADAEKNEVKSQPTGPVPLM